MKFKLLSLAALALLLVSSVAQAAPARADADDAVYGGATFVIDGPLAVQLNDLGIAASAGDVISNVGVKADGSRSALDYFDCKSFEDEVDSGTILGCLNGDGNNVRYETAGGAPLPKFPVTTLMDRAEIIASTGNGYSYNNVVHVVYEGGKKIDFKGDHANDELPGGCGVRPTTPDKCNDYPADVVGGEPEVNEVIRFRTYKDFVPNSRSATADVSINCNTGTILVQDYEMGDGDVVEFVVENFNPGDDIFCEITESGADNYTQEFVPNGGATSSSSCRYDGDEIKIWNTCTITNTAKPATLTVFKEWDYAGVDPADVVDDVWVFVECDDTIVKKPSGGIFYDQNQSVKILVQGEDDFEVEVDVTDGSSFCKVYEEVYDSAIEPDEGCTRVNLSINGSASCTLNNAVFFEGIPTLSQYGLAIMALLMLGVGFVGFRRFV